MKDTDYDDQKDEPTRRQDQDFDPPFSPPSDVKPKLPVDHPSKDDAVDEHEAYDEGADNAALDNPPQPESGDGPRPRKLF